MRFEWKTAQQLSSAYVDGLTLCTFHCNNHRKTNDIIAYNNNISLEFLTLRNVYTLTRTSKKHKPKRRQNNKKKNK